MPLITYTLSFRKRTFRTHEGLHPDNSKSLEERKRASLAGFPRNRCDCVCVCVCSRVRTGVRVCMRVRALGPGDWYQNDFDLKMHSRF